MLAYLCYILTMQAKTDSDRVREFARMEYIEPARARHESSVCIVAGEVQKAVRLNNRVPLVCQALKSSKFLDENHLVLERWEGPPSGMSTTVAFTYRILNAGENAAPSPRPDWPFANLRGIAKEVFSNLGGGEAFIQQEREQFHGPGHQPGHRSDDE
jgi:hypothetical protein